MRLRDWPARVVFRLRHPKPTVRWRLTLIYGGLFLICGAGLLAITYALVAHSLTPAPAALKGRPICARVVPNATDGRPSLKAGEPHKSIGGVVDRGRPEATCQIRDPKQAQTQVQRLLNTRAGGAVAQFVGRTQQVADLHELEIESGIALAIMAIISGALGWVVAGRVLRPLRTITASTQRISEANLHERLALEGPRDELRGLAATIDGLLERLEGAFAAQRQFVANASHELRTPLTAVRALLEMALSDPTATVATFREQCRQALEESHQQERLIDALLALAQGQRGIDRRQAIELSGLTRDVLTASEGAATAQGVTLEASLKHTVIAGDTRLIERLVANLVENAIRYNHRSGRVDAEVMTSGREARLTVTNTGPIVPAKHIDRLLQPFQRDAPDRVDRGGGLGLGLSIVAAIAAAHDAALDIKPRQHGGLKVEVCFPRRDAAPSPQPVDPADRSASVTPTLA